VQEHAPRVAASLAAMAAHNGASSCARTLRGSDASLASGYEKSGQFHGANS